MRHLLLLLFLFVSGTLFSFSQTGRALVLNGTSDYMEVADNDSLDINFGESRTICLWIKSTSTGGNYPRIIDKRVNSGIGYEFIAHNTSGVFGINLETTSGQGVGPAFGSTTVFDGNWHHLAAVVDAEKKISKIFVDGVEERSKTHEKIGTEAILNNETLRFGLGHDGKYPFIGMMDEIRFWKGAMTSSEVQAEMQQSVNGTEANLLAAWNFENASTSAVPDLVGNNIGSLYNEAIVVDPNAKMTINSVEVLAEKSNPVGRGTKDAIIGRIQISTLGASNPLWLSQINLSLEGTTHISDIDSVKVYISKDANLNSNELFGKAKVSNGIMSVSNSIAMEPGVNTCYVTYDIKANADANSSVLDLSCNSIVISDTTIVPEIKNPQGTVPLILEHRSIFLKGTDNTHTFRIPALVTAPNGDLVCAIDARRKSSADLKWVRDIDIAVKRSSDNGATWSDMEICLNLPDGEPVSDPSLIVDNVTNEIFLFYNYMARDTADGIFYFFVQKSSDNGKTWSNFENITPQIAKSEWYTNFKFITSGSGIQSRNGTLLHTIVNLQNGLHVFGSEDHGQTWFLKDVPVTPANESKIIELNDGTLMINSRLGKSENKRFVHRSTDNGQIWTGNYDESLVDAGCNASIIRYTSTHDGYAKNRLLFSNANHPNSRKNMTVKISYDEGLTWSEGKSIYTGGAAYSDLTILKDGTIGLVYENDGYEGVKFARFTLDWLTDGTDSLEEPITAVNEIAKTKDFFKVYPNPSNSVFTILLKNNKQAQVKVTNILGKKVLSKNISTKTNSSEIDLTGNPPGIYILNVIQDSQYFAKKIIIE